MSAPFLLLSYLTRPLLRGESAVGRAVAVFVSLPTTITRARMCRHGRAYRALACARALSRVFKSLSLGRE
jgi:hypothetical protein